MSTQDDGTAETLETNAVDPRIGQLFEGKYEIVAKLGAGGMGAVYEALHQRLGSRVAVKVLLPELAASPRARKRFEREARAAAATGHPNIAHVVDLGTAPDGAMFLVMERLSGRELADDIASEGPQSVAKSIHVARQVCSALSAVH